MPRQDIGQISTFQSFIFIKIYLSIKNRTDFRKTVETSVDLRMNILKNL